MAASSRFLPVANDSYGSVAVSSPAATDPKLMQCQDCAIKVKEDERPRQDGGLSARGAGEGEKLSKTRRS